MNENLIIFFVSDLSLFEKKTPGFTDYVKQSDIS